MTESAAAPQAPLGASYFNRELMWMAFNRRVVEEALDPGIPLLERLLFITIFHTNLDEFFMIRVSGLKQQVAAGVEMLSRDGASPRTQLHQIAQTLMPDLLAVQKCLHQDVLPALRQHGVELFHYEDLSPSEKRFWNQWYLHKVHPVLTPLAVGPTHPFPFISNLSLNIAVYVTSPSGERRLARVKVPPGLPQLIILRQDGTHALEPPVRLMLLEELIAANLDTLFPGMDLGPSWAFRVTRDADLEIREDEADDLMTMLQEELLNRRFGRAVRLEIQHGMPEEMVLALREGLTLDPGDVYEVDGLLGMERLAELVSMDLPELKFPPFVPAPSKHFSGKNLFDVIRHEDVLLHHPYDSFAPVVEFLSSAARDPKVLAIKQTLYRTSGDSPVVEALAEAVANGKQVAAIVELKARFDEENNITWARKLEESGVHVIYGVSGLKVHSKLALVVRYEAHELRRYAHISTGNYNPNTARLYTDLGLFTSDPGITADVAKVFNHLTGFSRPQHYSNLLVAPHWMKLELIKRIKRETAIAQSGEPAHLIFKCNSLTEFEVISALYEASNAGVKVDLLVRGICCLVPGVKGQSERISVRSVVGRFLEHSRIYWFQNAGDPEMFIGSADLMDRNLNGRVEVLTPIRRAEHKEWLRQHFLQQYLDEVARTRLMQPDGSYRRLRDAVGDGLDVQQAFLSGDVR